MYIKLIAGIAITDSAKYRLFRNLHQLGLVPKSFFETRDEAA